MFDIHGTSTKLYLCIFVFTTNKQPREPRASLLVEHWAKQTFAIFDIWKHIEEKYLTFGNILRGNICKIRTIGGGSSEMCCSPWRRQRWWFLSCFFNKKSSFRSLSINLWLVNMDNTSLELLFCSIRLFGTKSPFMYRWQII